MVFFLIIILSSGIKKPSCRLSCLFLFVVQDSDQVFLLVLRDIYIFVVLDGNIPKSIGVIVNAFENNHFFKMTLIPCLLGTTLKSSSRDCQRVLSNEFVSCCRTVPSFDFSNRCLENGN